MVESIRTSLNSFTEMPACIGDGGDKMNIVSCKKINLAV